MPLGYDSSRREQGTYKTSQTRAHFLGLKWNTLKNVEAFRETELHTTSAQPNKCMGHKWAISEFGAILCVQVNAIIPAFADWGFFC